MSMNLFLILSAGTPLNTNVLNEASRKLEPTVVYESNVDLAKHTGFLPVVLDKIKTGMETGKIEYAEISPRIPPHESIDPKTSVVIQLRWGGDMHEAAAALYTAALYSASFNGVVFEAASNMYLTAEQLEQGYQTILSMMPQ